MRTPLRRATFAITALLSVGALTPGLLAPATASANAAARAERAAQHAERVAERAARRQARERERDERREAHEREHRERREERERAARHQGRSESSTGTGQPETPNGGGETGAVATTPAAATAGCSATIQSSSNRITIGETIVLSGKVTCPSGHASTAPLQVTISQHEHGSGSPAASKTALAPVQTEADGSYKLAPLALEATSTFSVRIGDRGARTVVAVAPLVTLSAPAPVAKRSTLAGAKHAHGPQRVAFSGTVKPAEPGTIVSLQVADAGNGEPWRTVALGRVAADGSFTVSHDFRTPEQAQVRVIAHMHGRHVNGVSEVLEFVATGRSALRPAWPAS